MLTIVGGTMSTLLLGAVARRSASTVLALAVAGVTLQAAPASAAPAAPEITGPSGDTTPSVELTWQPVEGAAGYEVRVDNDPAFGSPEWTSTTVNTVSVPTKLLAKGAQYFQVRSKDAGGVLSDWSTGSFTVGTVAGPTLTGPVDGSDLAQPADPPLLTWTPVAGATSYTVEVDNETGFVGPSTYTTKATSFVVPDNQSPGVDYVWRVRADLGDGYSTEYSEIRSYSVLPIPSPEITGPTIDQDLTDVVLDWTPVAGAKYYELEVDDDINFGSPIDTQSVPDRIYGTRFSPKTTFGNGQYYWRVRARDLDDNPTAWVSLSADAHIFFDRVWRDQPQPVYPLTKPGGDPATVANDLYFEWTPVPHASNYEVWVSVDPNFTVTSKCVVAGTTYTPGEVGPGIDACMPAAEGIVHYWKVRPMDRPYASTGVEGIFSPTQRFVYEDQDAWTVSSPANGATVEVPTLSWAPINGTEVYEVKLLQGGLTLKTALTHSTSYSPFDLKLDPTKGPFTWQVRALDKANRTTTVASRTFTLGATSNTSTPLALASGPATFDAPALTWGAMSGAEYYRVRIADAATGNPYADSVAPILAAKLYYPAATDISTKFLDEGTYLWWVQAYDKNNLLIDTSSTGSFTVKPLGPVTGQRLALTGSALDSGLACTKTLSNGADQICTGVPATPVLDWDPVPYASEYRVRVSRDPDFTSGELAANPPRTVNTRWAPRAGYPYLALEESQANNAYYWFIQPCKSATQCGPDPKSTINPSRHAFRKISPKVELLSPLANAEEKSTEVTLTWKDYYDTNRATTYDATGSNSQTTELGYQSGMRYRVQVDDDPAFGSPADDVYVDQTTYTAVDRFYPEGPLYWRVQAVDGNGNALGWSDSRSFTKKSPHPTLVSPVADGGNVPVVSGTVPFRWEAQPFAGSYDIQVSANGDRNFSGVNLKVSTTAKKSAFSTGTMINFQNIATLQASDTPYVWRVRRVDTYGNKGPWSAVGEFKVALSQPTLLAPDSAATIGPRAVVLRWGAVAEAAKYRVELRRQGTTIVTTTTTPASAWAPLTAMAVGSTYEWRVAAVDVDGRYADPGAWRPFTIGGVPSADTPVTIDGTGVYDTTLTAVPPVWSVPGVTTTYQWRRNAVAIPGASGTTFTVRAGDVGASITVVATGTSAEFGTGTSTSAAIVGQAAPGAVATSAPEISGSGKVGTALTSTGPTWDPASTTTTLQWMRNGTVISGATDPTYVVAAADLNTTITLRATGTLPGRTPTVSVSNAITAVEGNGAVATTPPSIQGTPKVGTVLNATAPTWDQPGVQQTIQWLRGSTPINGATSSSYTVRAEDVDLALTVRYTGTLPGRAPTAVASAPVTGLLGDAPQATTSPVISGTPKVGNLLTTSTPTWNLAGVQQTVEWLRNGQPIAGQTTSAYTVRAEDVDASLTVRMTGTVAGRAPGTSTSTAVVGLVGDAPTALSSPQVTGTRKVGTALTSTAPAWNVTGVVNTIQWFRNGEAIPGETSAAYAVRPDDVGAVLVVRYTGTAPGRLVATTNSSPVTAIAGDAPTAPPMSAPTGPGQVGTTLVAPDVTWTPAAVQQSHQWLADGQPIAGETGTTYVVRASDVGLRISVRVTATRTGYANGVVTSPSVLVAAGSTTPPTTPPTPTTTPTTSPTPAPTATASSTVLKAPKSAKAGTRAKVTVKVSASGVASPLGVVKIYAGKKLVGKARLASTSKGLATVRLAKLAKGTYKLKATFTPSAVVAASTSKVITLKVVR